MSETIRVVGVSGSLSARSRTSVLVSGIVDAIGRSRDIEKHVIELGAIAPGFTGGLSRSSLSAEVLDALALVESADVLVVGSPVFRASYTGLFKHFFDFVGQYDLVDVPVILAATGGSDRHALLLEHQFRPLFGFFQALTLPIGVYATESEFTADKLPSPELAERIELTITRSLPLLDGNRLVPTIPQF